MGKILYADLFEYSNDTLAQDAWVTDASSLELDYMEYASDGAAQTAYVSDAIGLELDYMEYANDGDAQAAYVSSDVNGAKTQSNTDNTDSAPLGDESDVEIRFAQEFTLSFISIIDKIDVYFNANIGTPVGQVTLRIETDNAGLPSGTLAHANATKTITPVASSSNTFDFTNFSLNPGTYWIIFVCDNQSTNNRWIIGVDITPSPDDIGDVNRSLDGGTSWTAWSTTYNLTLTLYYTTYNLQCYSEPTIKNQGSYSLKAIAKQTDSLNDTLTKSGLSIDLTDIDELKFYAYASRTGTNLQVQLREAEIIESNFETGGDAFNSLGDWLDNEQWLGLEFTTGEDLTISAASIYIQGQNGSPTGDITFRIETDNAGKPSGTLAHANATGTVANGDIDASGWNKAEMSPFILTSGTYWLVYYIPDQATSTRWQVRCDNDGSGVYAYSNDSGSSWNTISNQYASYYRIYGRNIHTKDIVISSADTWEETVWDISAIANADKNAIESIVIKIINADSDTTYYIDNFAAIGGLLAYSEATIKQQGSYSLKLIADQTDSLDKTLTKSGLSIDLSNKNTLKFDIRGSRTGRNIEMQIRDSGYSLLLDEDCADISDWADGDAVNGESTQVTFDGKSCMKLDTKVAATGNSAKRYRTVIPSDNIIIELNLYLDNISTGTQNSFFLNISKTSTFKFIANFRSDGLFIDNGSYIEVGTDIVQQDVWQLWRFEINSTTKKCNVYLNNALVGSDVSFNWVTAPNDITNLYIQANAVDNLIAYVDYIKIESGIHRYTPNISVIDTWQTETWDISNIVNVDKDIIDKIIIKILNADATNTAYIDNFRAPIGLQCYSEGTIKVQGDYSLKALSLQTEGLNKTLTKTLTDYLDYSIQDVIKFDVRSSRTGSNIKLKIHDVGGTTSEHIINIAVADTWQTETWDISAITSTNRDAIDKIIIEISNADADATIYIDNLYSKAVVEHVSTWVG